eukprot:scaffold5478_cov161-Amphora_coffeaeformis.AAC.10
MDCQTDKRTHSSTTYFLKALHHQKPEPPEPPAGTPPVEAPQYLGIYVLHRPKHQVTLCTMIEALKCPDKRGRKQGSHSFGQSLCYQVAEIKSVKAFL